MQGAVKVNEGIPVRRHSVCEGVEVGSCRVLSGDGDYTVRDRRGGTTTTLRSDFLGPCRRKGVSCRVVQTGNHSSCSGGKG